MNIKELVKLGYKIEENYSEKVVRKLSDMKSLYRDQKEVDSILKKENPIIYEVYIVKRDVFDYGVTIIYPGAISKEFYMTSGHIHKKPSPETYILLEGSGKLLIQNEEEVKFINFIKNKEIIVPEGYAHRAINTSNKKLKFLAIYDPSSGHKYDVFFRKRFFKK